MAQNFFDFSLGELKLQMQEIGHKSFRAEQLFRWVYAHKIYDFTKMTNLAKSFAEDLPQLYQFEFPEIVSRQVSVDGTKKFLLKLKTGHEVEAVMIPSEGRRTICLSTEVGCNMACQFCYTGKQKLKKKLSAGEIVTQFLTVANDQVENEPITNIVFMGMGEPLDNTEAVFKSIEIFRSPLGLNLSRKKITVSTSGLVDQIPLVTQAGVRLAVSLNAVDDETRSKIMPINKKWPIASLLQACMDHAREANDKVTLEYVLLKGVTDSLEDAEKLHRLTKSVPSKINIIPFNEHPHSGFHRPSERQIQAFQKRLMDLGTHVLRRRTMGREILAACGQLTSLKKDSPISLTQP